MTDAPQTTEAFAATCDWLQFERVSLTLGEIREMKQEATRLRELLAEAARQIVYLHEKFQETGSGNAVLARINVEMRHD